MRWLVIILLLAACSEEVTEEEENILDLPCEQVIEESVSCGWPAYLPDGTRIDK